MLVFLILAGFAFGAVAAQAQEDASPIDFFVDDDDSVFEEDINLIASLGITRGCNPPDNDMFCPDDPLTRGEVAAFLARAGSLPATNDDFFVDDENVFELDINRIAAAGITKGCNPPDNTMYCPDDPIPRAQIAALLVRAYDLPEYSGPDLFVDVDNSVFKAEVQALAQAGITKGCNPPDDTMFCPDDVVTRGQIAALLARATKLDGDGPPDEPPDTDVPPVAIDDMATLVENAAATSIAVLANDENPDGGPISIESVTQPANGVVVVTGGGSGLTYQPDPDYCGTTPDTFTYALTPGSSSATVSVTVSCVDDSPVAVDDDASVEEDAAATAIDVLSNDSDPEGDPLTIGAVTQPANGTVVITNGGADLTYQPDADYCNVLGDPDEFTYTLAGGSTAVVSVSVGCVNDPPQVEALSVDAFTNMGISVPASQGLLSGATDPDENDDLTPVLTVDSVSATTPAGGSVSFDADTGAFDFDPPAGFTGEMSFDYTVCDNGNPLPSLCSDETVTATVDGPVIWFVDDDAPGGGDGTLTSPFDTIAEAATEIDTDEDERVFLYSGTYSDGIALNGDGWLVGQAVTGSSFDEVMGITPPELTAPRPAIGGDPATVGGTVTLDTGTVALGVNIDTGTEVAMNDTPAAISDVTVEQTTLTTTSGTALLLSDVSSSSFDFTTISKNGAGTGISLTSVNGTTTIAGGTIANTAGVGVLLTGGGGDFSYGGTVTNSTGRSIEVTDRTAGTHTFSGNVTATGGTGISLTNNTGSTLTFSGGVNLSTGAADAITATGGGTINMTGTGNNIITTTGIAVTISNTTIGDVTLEGLSVNGAPNGIVLTNTGTSGSFAVTGNGGTCTLVSPTCTGGRIQSTTGAHGETAGNGVYLADTGSVSLSFMRIDNHSNHAIFGDTVTGFSLIDSVVDGANGDSAAEDEGSIRFEDLLGSGEITRTDVSGGHEDNLRVVNTTGTLDRLVISDSLIHHNSNALGNDGILVESRDSAEMNLTVTNTEFSAHRGDHFDANATDTSRLDVVFTSNDMTGGHPNALGQTFILSNGASADVTFDVSDNTIEDSVLSAFTFFQSASTTVDSSLVGTFSGNTIGVTGDNGSGSSQGDGAVVNATGDGTVTVLLDGNEVRQWSNPYGILVQAGDGSPSLNVTVTNNTIKEPNTDSFPLNGLHLNAGTTAAGTASVCFDVRDNDLINSGGPGADDFRLRQRNNSTVNLPEYGGGPGDTAAVISYVQGNNAGVPAGSAAVSGSGGGFTGTGSSCPTP